MLALVSDAIKLTVGQLIAFQMFANQLAPIMRLLACGMSFNKQFLRLIGLEIY